jgi:DNA polymerase III subunit delta
MPSVSPEDVRAALAARTLAPIYLLLGDDDEELSRLAADFAGSVEEELRAFNVERIYAGEKGGTPAEIVEAARLLPMMADRRLVTVLRAERLLKPKRRGRAAEETDDGTDEPAGAIDLLTEYVQRPEPSTTLVLVAADIDNSRRIAKALKKTAAIVECWGLKQGKDTRGADLRDAVRRAEQIVRRTVSEAGQTIEPQAARLLAERAGFDIARLRGDLKRLMLYAADRQKITAADVREVVSAETAQDDWAVTNAIQQRNPREALRQLALALEAGAVPYMVLGQLAWFVREKLSNVDPRRVPAAVEALFRTDQDLKTSGGDPRVLLERLVVELCSRT